MSKSHPVERILEFSGYLNSFPATVLLRVQKFNHQYRWQVELYWDVAYAIDNNLPKEELWIHKDDTDYDDNEEAMIFGFAYLERQHWQFTKEVQ